MSLNEDAMQFVVALSGGASCACDDDLRSLLEGGPDSLEEWATQRSIQDLGHEQMEMDSQFGAYPSSSQQQQQLVWHQSQIQQHQSSAVQAQLPYLLQQPMIQQQQAQKHTTVLSGQHQQSAVPESMWLPTYQTSPYLPAAGSVLHPPLANSMAMEVTALLSPTTGEAAESLGLPIISWEALVQQPPHLAATLHMMPNGASVTRTGAQRLMPGTYTVPAAAAAQQQIGSSGDKQAAADRVTRRARIQGDGTAAAGPSAVPAAPADISSIAPGSSAAAATAAAGHTSKPRKPSAAKVQRNALVLQQLQQLTLNTQQYVASCDSMQLGCGRGGINLTVTNKPKDQKRGKLRAASAVAAAEVVSQAIPGSSTNTAPDDLHSLLAAMGGKGKAVVDAISQLSSRGVPVCVHLIEEGHEDQAATVLAEYLQAIECKAFPGHVKQVFEAADKTAAVQYLPMSSDGADTSSSADQGNISTNADRSAPADPAELPSTATADNTLVQSAGLLGASMFAEWQLGSSGTLNQIVSGFVDRTYKRHVATQQLMQLIVQAFVETGKGVVSMRATSQMQQQQQRQRQQKQQQEEQPPEESDPQQHQQQQQQQQQQSDDQQLRCRMAKAARDACVSQATAMLELQKEMVIRKSQQPFQLLNGNCQEGEDCCAASAAAAAEHDRQDADTLAAAILHASSLEAASWFALIGLVAAAIRDMDPHPRAAAAAAQAGSSALAAIKKQQQLQLGLARAAAIGFGTAAGAYLAYDELVTPEEVMPDLWDWLQSNVQQQHANEAATAAAGPSTCAAHHSNNPVPLAAAQDTLAATSTAKAGAEAEALVAQLCSRLQGPSQEASHSGAVLQDIAAMDADMVQLTPHAATAAQTAAAAAATIAPSAPYTVAAVAPVTHSYGLQVGNEANADAIAHIRRGAPQQQQQQQCLQEHASFAVCKPQHAAAGEVQQHQGLPAPAAVQGAAAAVQEPPHTSTACLQQKMLQAVADGQLNWVQQLGLASDRFYRAATETGGSLGRQSMVSNTIKKVLYQIMVKSYPDLVEKQQIAAAAHHSAGRGRSYKRTAEKGTISASAAGTTAGANGLVGMTEAEVDNDMEGAGQQGAELPGLMELIRHDLDERLADLDNRQVSLRCYNRQDSSRPSRKIAITRKHIDQVLHLQIGGAAAELSEKLCRNINPQRLRKDYARLYPERRGSGGKSRWPTDARTLTKQQKQAMQQQEQLIAAAPAVSVQQEVEDSDATQGAQLYSSR